jgi:membrane fusion protein (multidrug efflux system)
VHKGDVLAVIDQRNYQAELDQAKGDLATSQAQLDSARLELVRDRIVLPAQLASARAGLASAQAQLARASADDARQHNVPRAATSRESIDSADAAKLAAQGAVAQAQAQVAQADVVQDSLAIAAADVARLQGDVLAKQAKLGSADVDFYNTTITAPQDGWITKKNVDVGTFLQPGSQLFAIVTPNVFVTANFKEAQLTRMRAGDEVDIALDAYPDLKLKGHVDSIQLGTGSRFTAFPAENATGNFVKIVQRIPVKIVIDSGLDPAIPLSLGLSAEPTVTVR